MNTRPILFSGPMVRALLDGTKTQTRRIAPIRDLNIKPHSDDLVTWGVSLSKPVKGVLGSHSGGKFSELQARSIIASQFNRYGQPGDRLWVRENGWERPERTPKMMREGADTWEPYYYDADGLHYSEVEDFKRWGFKRRPSIHMPRWASRITLEITGVRVERLQDISIADAKAEGTPHDIEPMAAALMRHPSAIVQGQYAALWEQINGPGSWSANPWVWCVEFKKLEAT